MSKFATKAQLERVLSVVQEAGLIPKEVKPDGTIVVFTHQDIELVKERSKWNDEFEIQ